MRVLPLNTKCLTQEWKVIHFLLSRLAHCHTFVLFAWTCCFEGSRNGIATILIYNFFSFLLPLESKLIDFFISFGSLPSPLSAPSIFIQVELHQAILTTLPVQIAIQHYAIKKHGVAKNTTVLCCDFLYVPYCSPFSCCKSKYQRLVTSLCSAGLTVHTDSCIQRPPHKRWDNLDLPLHLWH